MTAKKSTILTIYTLLVCLICLCYLGPYMVKATRNLLRIACPSYMMSCSDYEKYILTKLKEGKSIVDLKNGEIWKRKVAVLQYSAKRDLIDDVVVIFFVTVIFLIHVSIFMRSKVNSLSG